MSASARAERSDDVYAAQSALAREIRELVADQLHDLTVEREELGSPDEIVERVNAIGQVSRRIREAIGRQAQATELGSPVAAHVLAEREGRELLRNTVMSLGAACAAWVVAMDYKARQQELEARG